MAKRLASVAINSPQRISPPGRLVLAERLAKPGARGRVAHGLTRDQAENLTGQLTSAGFCQVRLHVATAGHLTLVTVRGAKDPAT